MECDRLKRLIRTWYSQVQDETMAPARMITFMRQHVADCATCLSDPFVRPEIEKITNIVLPPEKLRSTADEDTDETETDTTEPSEDESVEDEYVDDDVEDDEDIDDEDD